MVGKMEECRLTGIQSEAEVLTHRWYSHPTILTSLITIAYERESKWQLKISDTEVKGIRHRCLGTSSFLKAELQSLGADQRPVGMMVSTQEIIWRNISPHELPPVQIRKKGKSGYNEELKIYQKDWKNIIFKDPEIAPIGQQLMIFDFDDVDLKVAWNRARSVYNYLRNEYSAQPSFIFSGNKGFHIWVHPEDIPKIISEITENSEFFNAFTNQTFGQLLARKVEEIVFEVTGSAQPVADLSPNYIQGMVRCPYSIHEKSGQVVWPLSQTDILMLEKSSFKVAAEVGKLLHPWNINLKEFPGVTTWIPPHANLYNRTLESLRKY